MPAINAPGASFHVPLSKLTHLATAQMAWALNAPGSATDFDGDPLVLRGDEFLAATASMAVGVDPQTRRALFNIERAMQLWPGVRIEEASAPAERILNSKVANAVGVNLRLGPTGPGRTVAHGGFSVDKQQGTGKATLSIPFPTATAYQAVDDARLELKLVDVHGKPVQGLTSHRVVTRGPGHRELELHFDLAKLPKPTFVRWGVPVELKNPPMVDLTAPVPLPKLSAIPPEARAFLGPETAIQSDHPEIVTLAAKLRAQSPTLQDLVKNTLAAVAAVPAKVAPTGKPYASDAVGYLRGGAGACDSVANLFSALLRANGVPCRPVSGILRGGNQDMHRQNEYWVPEKGWIHIEPQGTDIQTPRFLMVQTGVVPPHLNRDTSPTAEVLGRPSLTTQLDARGNILPRARRPLEVNYGLFVSNGIYPMLMAHAAS